MRWASDRLPRRLKRVFMTTDSSNSDIVDRVVVEYLDRKQSGEAPAIEEYCEKYPQHADEIRSLLQTVDQADAGFAAEQSKAEPRQPAFDEPQLEQIAGYRIVKEIGRGGMGVVYEAEHEALGRRAALKVLPHSVSQNRQAVQRFVREGKAIAKMHHSNIVPLYEVGEEDGRFFLAMQLIEGKSLDRVIREVAELRVGSSSSVPNFHSGIKKLFPPVTDHGSKSSASSPQNSGSHSLRDKYYRQIARVGSQAADALGYAHRRGFVHRDVKPSNLLLDCNGVTWLTDFGLAKSEDDDLTHTGDFVGTLRYMAPERFKGQCDERSDIYALGLTLYELLALSPAFDSSDRLSTIRQITHEDPPRLRSVNHTIPRDLETIVMKAIDKNSKSRFSSAGALADDLNNFINDLPIKARRHSALERVMRWSRRNRGVAAALALATTALVLLAIVSSYSAITQSALRFKAEEARKESDMRGEQLATRSEQLAARSEQLSARGEQLQSNLYAAEMMLAASATEQTGGISRVRELLSNWIPTDGETDLRGPEWHYLNGLGRNDILTLADHDGPIVAVDFAPDNQSFASVGTDGFLRISSAIDGKNLIPPQPAYQVAATDVAFDPSGNIVATAAEDGLIILWDVKTGNKLRVLKDHKKRVRCIQFHPEGKYLASGGDDGLRIWDPKTGEMLSFMRPSQVFGELWDVDEIADLDWRPNHDQVATISDNDKIIVWDVATGKRNTDFAWINELPELKFWFGNKSIAWSPTGDRILACGRECVVLYLPRDGQPPHAATFETLGGEVFSGGWTKDGKTLITSGEGLELTLRDATTLRETTRIRGHEDSILDFAVSADGQKLVSASSDATVKVWQMPDQERNQLWAEGAAAISPDSRMVALSGGSRPEVLIADLETGQIVKRIESPRDTWVGFAEWSPDGDRLATGSGNGAVPSQVHIWDSNSGELVQALDVKAAYIQSIAWHPTEPNFVAISQNSKGPLEFWDAQKGELLETQDFRCWVWDSLEWSPDGKILAIAGWRPNMIDWASRKEVASLSQEHTEATRCVRFSADGQRMATSADDRNICIYDTDGWKHLATLEGHTGPVSHITWSPDRTRLASASTDSTLRIWDISSGNVVLRVDLGSSQPRSLQWSDDGRFIVASVNGRLRILKMAGVDAH